MPVSVVPETGIKASGTWRASYRSYHLREYRTKLTLALESPWQQEGVFQLQFLCALEYISSLETNLTSKELEGLNALE